MRIKTRLHRLEQRVKLLHTPSVPFTDIGKGVAPRGAFAGLYAFDRAAALEATKDAEPNPEMLELTRRNLKERGYPGY